VEPIPYPCVIVPNQHSYCKSKSVVSGNTVTDLVSGHLPEKYHFAFSKRFLCCWVRVSENMFSVKHPFGQAYRFDWPRVQDLHTQGMHFAIIITGHVLFAKNKILSNMFC